MAQQMVEITFDEATGAATIEAHGYQGRACEAATKSFEEALGGVVTKRTLKPEHRQQALAAATATAGGQK